MQTVAAAASESSHTRAAARPRASALSASRRNGPQLAVRAQPRGDTSLGWSRRTRRRYHVHVALPHPVSPSCVCPRLVAALARPKRAPWGGHFQRTLAQDTRVLKIRGPANLAGAWSAQPVPASQPAGGRRAPLTGPPPRAPRVRRHPGVGRRSELYNFCTRESGLKSEDRRIVGVVARPGHGPRLSRGTCRPAAAARRSHTRRRARRLVFSCCVVC